MVRPEARRHGQQRWNYSLFGVSTYSCSMRELVRPAGEWFVLLTQFAFCFVALTLSVSLLLFNTAVLAVSSLCHGRLTSTTVSSPLSPPPQSEVKRPQFWCLMMCGWLAMESTALYIFEILFFFFGRKMEEENFLWKGKEGGGQTWWNSNVLAYDPIDTVVCLKPVNNTINQMIRLWPCSSGHVVHVDSGSCFWTRSRCEWPKLPYMSQSESCVPSIVIMNMRISREPWCNPLWLTGLKAATN